ncbi:hypothetical protein NI26_15590 [Curtobacterium sp. MR_MD2014]|nr:hypothetical protein NI26_15590 [Curtobacterium sp. MR_MD2014]
MDIAALAGLPRLFSAARLCPYLAACDGDRAGALRLYAWNIEMTAAFWGPIAVLEVAVRNAMHDALRAGRNDDWWNDEAVHLMPRERRAVDGATDTLMRRGFARPTADQVVAATSFGFWVGLTDAGVPRHPTLSYETVLWQPRLTTAFPHRGTLRRKGLHRLLDDVRRFRNRLAHHEPIHTAPLGHIRDDIARIAGAVSRDAERLIVASSRIDAVLDRRDEALQAGRTVI